MLILFGNINFLTLLETGYPMFVYIGIFMYVGSTFFSRGGKRIYCKSYLRIFSNLNGIIESVNYAFRLFLHSDRSKRFHMLIFDPN